MADEYGVKIWNDTGSVQIDSSYRNVSHIGIIRVTDLGSTGWAEVPIDNDKWYVLEPQMFSNTTRSAFLESYTTTNGFQRTVKVNYPVIIHVFGFVNVPAPDPYGIQIFDSQGALCFDSSFRPLKILDHISGQITVAQVDSNDTVTLLSKNYGKRIGFCISRQIQVTGYTSSNFYNKCLFFCGRNNGVAIVEFKTAYTSWPYGDTSASSTTLTGSSILRYEFSVVDCSFLPT